MATTNDTTKTITLLLPQGYSTIIDSEDECITKEKWYSLRKPSGRVYAVRPGVRLHRLIMERVIGRTLESNEIVDHIDNDPLNNVRSNLRLATNKDNVRNSRMRENNTSGYKGVFKHHKRFRAQIKVDNKSIYLGVFDTPEEAHAAYCEAAVKYHGEFARFE